ncbi:MAG: hypothetical protein AAFN67_09280, partial [Pseudomonadota bacterium]
YGVSMLTAVKRNTNGTNLTRVSLKGILGISFLAALTYAPFINWTCDDLLVESAVFYLLVSGPNRERK